MGVPNSLFGGRRWFVWGLVAVSLLGLAATSVVFDTGTVRDPRWIEVRQGTVVSTVDGERRSGPATLSYHWDRMHRGRPGEARFELPFDLPAAPREPWGIFIPRVGSVFEVRMNGHLLQTYGDFDQHNGADHAKAPLLVPVPALLMQAGRNLIRIDLRADSGRRAGLSAITLGPEASLRDGPFASAYAWRFTGSVLLAGFSAVVGAISLALWFTQVDASAVGGRRREGLYLWAALAEFFWALRLADGVIVQPPLPWVAWGTAMTACYSAWSVSAIMFCQHVAGWHVRPRARWLPWAAAVVFGVPVLATHVALSRGEPWWLTGWLALESVAVTAYVLFFVYATLRRPSLPRVMVASVAILTLLVAVRDLRVIRFSDAYGETTWVRYISVFFAIALLGIVVTRFRQASDQVRDLLATLSRRVADRERELALTYGRLETVAREQARTHERERILRDMHDGVGAHISTAIRQLQSGQLNPDMLLRTLRDSMVQLKLSIDSIHLPPGDVESLLAGLRYRLAGRFSASDIVLEWAVEALRPVARLDAQGMRQLQFLLFEAISNALQHAGAGVLRIEAEMEGAAVRIRVIDDGAGFDAAVVPRALASRAAAIDAVLRLQSRPGRTVVDVELA